MPTFFICSLRFRPDLRTSGQHTTGLPALDSGPACGRRNPLLEETRANSGCPLTFGNSCPNILLCRGSTPPTWSDVAVPKRLGRPTEPGGLGPADDAHAQEGGG